jgi:2-polyprenyl-3-methyl-5-hydroxy-6-metoxy-1,4-benzoquinol methylase
MTTDRAHWEHVYAEREPDEVSWYEPTPDTSLTLIREAGLPADAAILDVGGGVSRLAGALLAAGYSDVTVADISAAALRRAQTELGDDAKGVTWVEADVRDHDFGRRYDLWHDRAVLHFMVAPGDREAYVDTLERTVQPGGHVIVATFGPDGPTRCSALPVARYGAPEVSRLLGDGFEPLSSMLRVHRTPSGSEQQFLHAHLRRRR